MYILFHRSTEYEGVFAVFQHNKAHVSQQPECFLMCYDRKSQKCCSRDTSESILWSFGIKCNFIFPQCLCVEYRIIHLSSISNVFPHLIWKSGAFSNYKGRSSHWQGLLFRSLRVNPLCRLPCMVFYFILEL